MAGDETEDVKVLQIRQAAKTLFLRCGFAQVSTAALAKEAGISKETLYSRFPHKEAVLADVLEHLVSAGEFDEPVEPAPTSMAGLSRALRQLAHGLSRELMQREYIELARIIIAETPRLPHVAEIFRRSVPERAFRQTTGLLRAAAEARIIRDVDETTAARMFVGGLLVPALLNVLLVAPRDDEPSPQPVDVDAHVDLFLAAIASDGR